MLERISTDTFCQKAYTVIKGAIIEGSLKPGTVVVTERLAEELNISLTPIREALIRLTSEGFIEYKSNKQRCIALITVESVRESYEVRRLLEPYAVARLAECVATSDEIRKQLIELREPSDPGLLHVGEAGSYENVMAMDLRLGSILLEGVNGSFLGEVLHWVNDRSLRIRTFLETSTQGEREAFGDTILQEHSQIIEALLDGNPEQARIATGKHLANAEKRTMSI
ncbi:unnamed protein product, partial [marine sediment metagenome]